MVVVEKKKLILGILGSTNGTDLIGVLNAIKFKELNAEVAVVISNKKDSGILEKARANELKDVFVDAIGKKRHEFDREVMKVLEENKVDLVLLIGYMRILSPEFVRAWGFKSINVHPSLLPSFAGGMDKNVHQSVLDSGVKVSGCTVHFVTEKPDSGPIILQRSVPVFDDDTVESLKKKVQEAEQEIIIKAIRLFAENKLVVEENRVKIKKDDPIEN